LTASFYARQSAWDFIDVLHEVIQEFDERASFCFSYVLQTILVWMGAYIPSEPNAMRNLFHLGRD
jgi:hypothetical protein